MVNKHEILVIIIFQLALIITVQNLFPVFSTYGQYLKEDHPYINSELNSSRSKFYRFSKVDQFYSAHLEFLSDHNDVNVFWWKKVTTIQVTGVFFGSILFGWLSDVFGRKPICMFSCLSSAIILALEGFLSSTLLISICRFLIGTQSGSLMVVSWSLVCEIISPQNRFYVRSFANWPNAKVALVMICYLSQNWRISLHVFSVLTFITFLLYWLLMTESPIWLESNGRLKDAELIYRKNKISTDGISNLQKIKTLRFSDIWKNKYYRNTIILFGAIWMMTNFTSYMLDYSEVAFFESLMSSQILLAVTTSIWKISVGLLDYYFNIINRRNLHLLSLFINLISMVLSGIFIIAQWNDKHPLIYVSIYLLGYCSLESIWDSCYLCIVEQVPTEVRGTIGGFCSFLSRLASIIATNMVDVKQLWTPAPLFIASIIAGIHFVLAYKMLKESKNVNLNEVGHDLRRKQKISLKFIDTD